MRKKKIRALFVTNTTEVIPTLMMWLGLRGEGLLRVLLVGPPKSGKSRVMIQTKRYTLALQTGG